MRTDEFFRGFVPRSVWIITAAVVVAVMILSASFPLIATDTLGRYAPMAEAFSAGEWREAFHPRFGVGMTVLSGIVCWLMPIDGYAACAVVASAAWAFGALFVWRIAAHVFDRGTAWFAFVLYLISPQILLWGLEGLREPFKTLGVLMMTDALFCCIKREPRWWIGAAFGAVLLLTIKPDTIALCGCLVIACGCVERFGRGFAALVAVAIAALQPMCLLTWGWTGYWVPSVQFVVVLKRMFGGC